MTWVLIMSGLLATFVILESLTNAYEERER